MTIRLPFARILLSTFLIWSFAASGASDSSSNPTAPPADEYNEALEAIANDRYGTIAGIVAIKGHLFTVESDADLTALLNTATDAQLLDIQNATSYDAIIAILQGLGAPIQLEGVTGTEALGDISRDLTYTPVTPCRFFDTRNAIPAVPPQGGNPGTQLHYLVYGSAAALVHQGHTAGTGCTSPGGEPAAIAANFTVVPGGKGHIRVWPRGFAQPNASFLNYNNTVNSNLANAGIIATRFSGSGVDDISVSTWFGGADSLGDVMGYFYPAQFRTVTKYLTLAGGHCKAELNTFAGTNDTYFCDLTQGGIETQANWSAPLPTGAVVRSIKMRVYSNGATTTCSLRRGTNNAGINVVSVSDSTSGWHDSAEIFVVHTVSNSSQGYAVTCSTGSTANDVAIGYVRIRYTTQSPN